MIGQIRLDILTMSTRLEFLETTNLSLATDFVRNSYQWKWPNSLDVAEDLAKFRSYPNK